MTSKPRRDLLSTYKGCVAKAHAVLDQFEAKAATATDPAAFFAELRRELEIWLPEDETPGLVPREDPAADSTTGGAA